MFKLVVVALAVASVSAYDAPVGLVNGCANCGQGLGLGLGLATNKGLGLALPANNLGLGFGLALNNGYGQVARNAVPIGPVTAAIQSTRSYEVIPVALNYEAPVPQVIDVPPNFQPLSMIWRTQSSPLNMEQIHTPAAGQHESTRSEDQPSIMTHESYKPVIQEFREVIQPHRNIEQKILPVIEHVHTIVAKGEEYHQAPIAFAGPALVKEAPIAFAGPALVKEAPLQFAGPVFARGGYKAKAAKAA